MAEESTPVRLTVDGEQFEARARPGHRGQYDVEWLSGPNPGYGFSTTSSDRSAFTADQLEASIRSFLGQIDRTTGYLD